MKNHFTVIAGIVALLLLTGAVREKPDTPPRVGVEESVGRPATPVSSAGTGSSSLDVGAASVLGSSVKPEAPQAQQDMRPEVLMYAPKSCVVCDVLDGEIEKAGGEKALPFRLVKKPLMDWMTDGPWFYWRADGSRIDWMRLHGLGTLNGKRLDFLLQEWLKTQPEARETVSQGQDGVTICCCKGTDTAACLCLEEIRNGIDRGPCTCNDKFGSRHFMDANGCPIGPAGGYRELSKR